MWQCRRFALGIKAQFTQDGFTSVIIINRGQFLEFPLFGIADPPCVEVILFSKTKVHCVIKTCNAYSQPDIAFKQNCKHAQILLTFGLHFLSQNNFFVNKVAFYILYISLCRVTSCQWTWHMSCALHHLKSKERLNSLNDYPKLFSRLFTAIIEIHQKNVLVGFIFIS